MNERIYILASKADSIAREIEPDLREIVRYNKIRDEKFAELIVRDICDYVNEQQETISKSILIMYGLRPQ